MSVIVHIQISGRDRPNAVGDLITILARHAVPVLDLNQRMACGTLSLGVLAALPEAPDRCPTFKELEARAMDLELTIHPHVIPANAYRTWVAEQRASRHVLTLLGREVGAKPIAEAAGLAAALGLRITGMTRLSAPREGDAEGSACFEMDLHGPTPDASALHDALPRLAEEMGLDLVLQEDDAFRRHRRLICFDMDSTLIQAEVIDELAAEVGIEAQVAAITESAMRGEIDFPESFRRRMALLKGLDESVLTRVAERLPITEGAARLIANLKARGYKTAILSGGFTYFAQCLSKRLGGIDYIHANTLDFRDGRLTGEVSGEIVDGPRKAVLLREIAAREGLVPEQVIAVGDGANDLPMLAAAGLGIAFHAKPIVRKKARYALNHVGLDGVLRLLGLRDRELTPG